MCTMAIYCGLWPCSRVEVDYGRVEVDCGRVEVDCGRVEVDYGLDYGLWPCRSAVWPSIVDYGPVSSALALLAVHYGRVEVCTVDWTIGPCSSGLWPSIVHYGHVDQGRVEVDCGLDYWPCRSGLWPSIVHYGRVAVDYEHYVYTKVDYGY